MQALFQTFAHYVSLFLGEPVTILCTVCVCRGFIFSFDIKDIAAGKEGKITLAALLQGDWTTTIHKIHENTSGTLVYQPLVICNQNISAGWSDPLILDIQCVVEGYTQAAVSKCITS